MYRMYSLSNTTNLKLQIERRMSYKLETANCTPQYLSKKMVVFVRLELTTWTFSACLQYLSPKKSCLCEVRTHDIHVIAWHSTTQKLPRMYHGGQKQTSINIAQMDILRTWLCETCSGSPQKCFCDCDNKVVLVYQHTYELQASFFFVVFVWFPWQQSDRGTFTNIGHNSNTLIALTKCGRIMTKGTTWHKNWKIVSAQSPFTILEVPHVSF